MTFTSYLLSSSTAVVRIYYNYFQRLNQCTGRAAEIMACISDDKTLTNNLFILEDYIGKNMLGRQLPK